MVKNQRGDTLIEVTIALTIMATVLSSAFYLANRSIEIGRIAKERSLLVSAAEQQAEALTTYRDQKGWATFVHDVRTVATGPTCFYIDPTAITLSTGAQPLTTVATSNICITSDITAGSAPNPATFKITYTAVSLGGGPDINSSLYVQLGDTDALKKKVIGP